MTISFNKRDLRVIVPTLIVGLLLAPTAARSQFGIPGLPQPVIDLSAISTLGHIWEEDISTTAKIVQEIQQMEKIYNQGVQTYNLGLAMSQRFTNKPWRTYGMNLLNVTTPNRFGETVNWDAALNTGAGAAAAWQSGTFALGNMSFVQGTTQARTLGHIEMADSAGQSAVATLGACNAISARNEPILTNLEQTVLDGTDVTNTAIRQVNLTNSALAQQNRMLQCSQAIQYEQAKQAVVANIRNRDAEAAVLNTYADAVDSAAMRPSNLSGMQNTLFDVEVQ